jgi:hypothetical protein
MTEYKRDKVMLSEAVVMKRVNRFLAHKGHKLHKLHPPRGKKRLTDAQRDLGRFYISSESRVVERHVDLEGFARKHEIIASYEACTRG